MEEDKKTVLKVVKLLNDVKCAIIKNVHSEEDCYFEEISYCYERCGDLEFKISMSCFSNEDGDRYSVSTEYPKDEVLLRNCKEEAKALEVFNSNRPFGDKVPALGWRMVLS